MSRVAAVVFDFDGVILDSESAEYEANRRIFESCGTTLSVEEWCDCIGVWVEDEARRWWIRLRERSGSTAPLFEHFVAEKRRLFQELIAPTPMDGIISLLDALDAAKVPCAIASTSPSRWVVPAATEIGVVGRMRAILTSDDVQRGKPAPDVYLEATRRLEVDPRRSIAIEDSGPGVAAAAAAGLRTIAVPHWLTKRHDFSRAHRRVAHAGEITIGLLESLMEEET